MERLPQPLICIHCAKPISYEYVKQYWIGYIKSINTERRKQAARINGQKGGRPKKSWQDKKK